MRTSLQALSLVMMLFIISMPISAAIQVGEALSTPEQVDYKIIAFDGKELKAFPLIDDVDGEKTVGYSFDKELASGKRIKVQNESAMTITKNDGRTLFTIRSTAPILQVGDIKETHEWGYVGVAEGQELITGDHLRVIGGYVCLESTARVIEQNSFNKKIAYMDCIYYPPQNKNITASICQDENCTKKRTWDIVDMRQIEQINDQTVSVTFTGDYDPTYTGFVDQTNIIEMWLLDENTGSTAYGNRSVMNLAIANSDMWATGYTGTGIEVNETIDADLKNTNLVSGIDFGNYDQWLLCLAVNHKEVSISEVDTYFAVGDGNTAGFMDTYPYHYYLRVRFTNASGSSPWSAMSGHGMQVGEWHRLCGGFNETHSLLYLDGYLNETTALPGQKESQLGEDFRIGEGGYDGGDLYGIVDEIVVFNVSGQEAVDYYMDGCYRGGCEEENSTNTPPTTPTIITRDGTTNLSGAFSGVQAIQCSGSTDADNDTMTYFLEKGVASSVVMYVNTTTLVTADSDSGNDTIQAQGENCGSGECAADAFDRSTSTKWLDFASTSWITVQLGTAAKRVGTYQLCSANDVPGRDPDDWTIDGSNDGTTWTQIAAVTGNGQFSSRDTCYNFTIANPGLYQYYKLNITGNNGESIVQLSEIRFFEQNQTNITTYNFTELGSHQQGSAYSWDLSAEQAGKSYAQLRCKAKDTLGSNTYSAYYTLNTSFTISEQEETPANKTILIVAGSSSLSGSEANLRSYLESNPWHNFTIYAIIDDNWNNLTSYASAIDAYLIFESVSTSTLGTKLRNASKPILFNDNLPDTELDVCAASNMYQDDSINVVNTSVSFMEHFGTGVTAVSSNSGAWMSAGYNCVAGGTIYAENDGDSDYKTIAAWPQGVAGYSGNPLTSLRVLVPVRTTDYSYWLDNHKELYIKAAYYVASNGSSESGAGSSATEQEMINLLYDANGNLVWDGETFREYNSLNQLSTIYNGTDNTTLLQTFKYHPLEERVLVKTTYNPDSSVKETVYYFSKEYVRVVNASGSFDTEYVYLNGDLVAEHDLWSDEKRFVSTDHLGSSSVITDESGAVVDNASYSPFGEILTGGDETRYGYTGQEYDDVSGDYDYNARQYQADVGLFTQPDRIIQNKFKPQDLNHYMYVRGNPYKYYDPDGRAAVIMNYELDRGGVLDPQHSSVFYGSDASFSGDEGGWTGYWYGTNEEVTLGEYRDGEYTNGRVLRSTGRTLEEAVSNLDRQVGPDVYHDRDSAVTFKTTPEHDELLVEQTDALMSQKDSSDTYNAWDYNCADFVRESLASGGIETKDTLTPKSYLRKAERTAKKYTITKSRTAVASHRIRSHVVRIRGSGIKVRIGK